MDIRNIEGVMTLSHLYRGPRDNARKLKQGGTFWVRSWYVRRDDLWINCSNIPFEVLLNLILTSSLWCCPESQNYNTLLVLMRKWKVLRWTNCLVYHLIGGRDRLSLKPTHYTFSTLLLCNAEFYYINMHYYDIIYDILTWKDLMEFANPGLRKGEAAMWIELVKLRCGVILSFKAEATAGTLQSLLLARREGNWNIAFLWKQSFL